MENTNINWVEMSDTAIVRKLRIYKTRTFKDQ
jgi:hypothetical protein